MKRKRCPDGEPDGDADDVDQRINEIIDMAIDSKSDSESYRNSEEIIMNPANKTVSELQSFLGRSLIIFTLRDIIM